MVASNSVRTTISDRQQQAFSTQVNTNGSYPTLLISTFRKGPINTPTLIRGERELNQIYGKPNNETQADYIALTRYLRYGGQAFIVRIAPRDNFNAAYRRSDELRVFPDRKLFTTREEAEAQFNLEGNNYELIARNPGSWANNHKVVLLDHGPSAILTKGTDTNTVFSASGYALTSKKLTKNAGGSNSLVFKTEGNAVYTYGERQEEKDFNNEIATGDITVTEFDYENYVIPGTAIKLRDIGRRPGSTVFGKSNNILLDEVHFAVIDTVKNSIVESFVGLSKISDARTPEDKLNYFIEYINENSNYIFIKELDNVNLVASVFNSNSVAKYHNFIGQLRENFVEQRNGIFYLTPFSAQLFDGRTLSAGTDNFKYEKSDIDRVTEYLKSNTNFRHTTIIGGGEVPLVKNPYTYTTKSTNPNLFDAHVRELDFTIKSDVEGKIIPAPSSYLEAITVSVTDNNQNQIIDAFAAFHGTEGTHTNLPKTIGNLKVKPGTTCEIILNDFYGIDPADGFNVKTYDDAGVFKTRNDLISVPVGTSKSKLTISTEEGDEPKPLIIYYVEDDGNVGVDCVMLMAADSAPTGNIPDQIVFQGTNKVLTLSEYYNDKEDSNGEFTYTATTDGDLTATVSEDNTTLTLSSDVYTGGIVAPEKNYATVVLTVSDGVNTLVDSFVVDIKTKSIVVKGAGIPTQVLNKDQRISLLLSNYFEYNDPDDSTINPADNVVYKIINMDNPSNILVTHADESFTIDREFPISTELGIRVNNFATGSYVAYLTVEVINKNLATEDPDKESATETIEVAVENLKPEETSGITPTIRLNPGDSKSYAWTNVIPDFSDLTDNTIKTTYSDSSNISSSIVDGNGFSFEISSSANNGDSFNVKLYNDAATVDITLYFIIEKQVITSAPGITQPINAEGTGLGINEQYTLAVEEPLNINLNDFYTDGDSTDSLTYTINETTATIVSSDPIPDNGIVEFKTSSIPIPFAGSNTGYTIEVSASDGHDTYNDSFVIHLKDEKNIEQESGVLTSIPSKGLATGSSETAIDLAPLFLSSVLPNVAPSFTVERLAADTVLTTTLADSTIDIDGTSTVVTNGSLTINNASTNQSYVNTFIIRGSKGNIYSLHPITYYTLNTSPKIVGSRFSPVAIELGSTAKRMNTVNHFTDTETRSRNLTNIIENMSTINAKDGVTVGLGRGNNKTLTIEFATTYTGASERLLISSSDSIDKVFDLYTAYAYPNKPTISATYPTLHVSSSGAQTFPISTAFKESGLTFTAATTDATHTGAVSISSGNVTFTVPSTGVSAGDTAIITLTATKTRNGVENKNVVARTFVYAALPAGLTLSAPGTVVIKPGQTISNINLSSTASYGSPGTLTGNLVLPIVNDAGTDKITYTGTPLGLNITAAADAPHNHTRVITYSVQKGTTKLTEISFAVVVNALPDTAPVNSDFDIELPAQTLIDRGTTDTVKRTDDTSVLKYSGGLVEPTLAYTVTSSDTSVATASVNASGVVTVNMLGNAAANTPAIIELTLTATKEAESATHTIDWVVSTVDKYPVPANNLSEVSLEESETIVLDLSSSFSLTDGDQTLTYEASFVNSNPTATATIAGNNLTIVNGAGNTEYTTNYIQIAAVNGNKKAYDSFTVITKPEYPKVVNGGIENFELERNKSEYISVPPLFSHSDTMTYTVAVHGDGSATASLSATNNLTVTMPAEAPVDSVNYVTLTATAGSQKAHTSFVVKPKNVRPSIKGDGLQNRMMYIDGNIEGKGIINNSKINLGNHFQSNDGLDLLYTISITGDKLEVEQVDTNNLSITIAEGKELAVGDTFIVKVIASNGHDNIIDAFIVEVINREPMLMDDALPNIEMYYGDSRTFTISDYFSDKDDGDPEAEDFESNLTYTVEQDDASKNLISIKYDEESTELVITGLRSVLGQEFGTITINATDGTDTERHTFIVKVTDKTLELKNPLPNRFMKAEQRIKQKISNYFVDHLVDTYNTIDDTVHKYNKVIEIAQAKTDAVAIISPIRSNLGSDNAQTTNNIIAFFDRLTRTSYAVFDTTLLRLRNRFTGRRIVVPGSGDVAGIINRTMINDGVWVSPAGTTRGAFIGGGELVYNPNTAERDRLYIKGINPTIQDFQNPITLYGDSTAILDGSVFEDLSTRLLFIGFKNYLDGLVNQVLFNQNNEATREAFVTQVDIYLGSIAERNGIENDFRIICDESNNTPNDIAERRFNADIYIRKRPTVNFVNINVVASDIETTIAERFGEVDNEQTTT